MKHLDRILSVCLVLALLLVMMPFAAFADSPSHTAHAGSDPHTGWTPLTAELVSSNNGRLTDGQYYLESDVILNRNIYINGGSIVELCLNGHTLTGTGSGSVISVYGTNTQHTELTLYDIQGDVGCITGGKGNTGGVSISNAVFTMTGGTISGNVANDCGGGVDVRGGSAVFTMTGGNISGNEAKGGYGGGVYSDFATTVISGGTISGNTAKYDGGGVYVSFGTATLSDCAVTANTTTVGFYGGGGVCFHTGVGHSMTNVTISGNHSATSGGGVQIRGGNNAAAVALTDVTVSGNTAVEDGGGLYIEGELTMSGSNTVKNNTSGIGGGVKTDNTYVASGTAISLSGALTGSQIGVTMQAEGEQTLTSGWNSYMSGKAPADYFSSDDLSYRFDEKNGEVTRVSDIYSISKGPMTNGDILVTVGGATAEKASGGQTVTLTATPNGGCRLKSLTVTNTSTLEEVTVIQTDDLVYTFQMPSADVAISAAFEQGEVLMSWAGLQQRFNNAQSGDTITLSNDVTAAEADTRLVLDSGENITLDLNGYTLDRGLSSKTPVKQGNVITVSSDVLTVQDNSAGQTGRITGGNWTGYNVGDGAGGIHVYGKGNQAKLILAGGEISGNTGSCGAGVSVYSPGSSFEMTGGKISGNTVISDSLGGGGVFVGYDAAVTLTGGEISGNTSALRAAGVQVGYLGSFTMTGGKITGNTANGIPGDNYNKTPVGGVGIEDFGSVFLYGGEISGNSALNGYGGIFSLAGNSNAITLHGSPKVTGNTGGWDFASNVYFSSGCFFFDGALSSDARIGINGKRTPDGAPEPALTSGMQGNTAAPLAVISNFVSDESGRGLCVGDDGELYMGDLYIIRFEDEDGTELLTASYPAGTRAVDIATPADPVKQADIHYRYTFTGWTPAITNVTGAATYQAVYTSTAQTYTLTGVLSDGKLTDYQITVPDGGTLNGAKLIAASYQNDRFLDAVMIDPAASGKIQDLIVGSAYQLILIDQNGVPLCAAWNSK